MGDRITEINPCGKMVVLKFVEIKSQETYKLVNKILMPNEKAADEKKRVYATVFKLGPDVDATTATFKVGDRVFYNDYDCKVFGDGEVNYGLTKADSIWATYKEDDDE